MYERPEMKHEELLKVSSYVENAAVVLFDMPYSARLAGKSNGSSNSSSHSSNSSSHSASRAFYVGSSNGSSSSSSHSSNSSSHSSSRSSSIEDKIAQ